MTATAGYSGRLMIVKIGGVALVGQIGGSLDGTRDIIDLTSLSSEYVKQFAAGDYGYTFSFNGLYDPSGSMSASEIKTAFEAEAAQVICWGAGTFVSGGINTYWTASGHFTAMSIAADYTGPARVSGTVQITGAVTQTAMTTA